MKQKRKLFVALALTLLSAYSFAQQRIEISGTDTSAILPIKQVREALVKFVELKNCKEENDSLFSHIRSYTGLCNNQKSTIRSLKDVLKIEETLLADKQAIIDLSNKQLKKSDTKIKILKLERIIFPAISFVAGGYLTHRLTR